MECICLVTLINVFEHVDLQQKNSHLFLDSWTHLLTVTHHPQLLLLLHRLSPPLCDGEMRARSTAPSPCAQDWGGVGECSGPSFDPCWSEGCWEMEFQCRLGRLVAVRTRGKRIYSVWLVLFGRMHKKQRHNWSCKRCIKTVTQHIFLVVWRKLHRHLKCILS